MGGRHFFGCLMEKKYERFLFCKHSLLSPFGVQCQPYGKARSAEFRTLFSNILCFRKPAQIWRIFDPDPRNYLKLEITEKASAKDIRD